LPSMNDLRAKLIGLITMPATKFVRLASQPAAQLARVMRAKAQQTSSQS